jgi:hypothetical protein
VEGQAERGCTSVFELIGGDFDDHPDPDYSEVSPRLQRIRGPYPIGDGIAVYERHVRLHQQPGRRYRPGPVADAGFRR